MICAQEAPMGVIQVQLPDHIREAIDRQVAGGRVASESEFLVEAARRYAEDLETEDAIVAEATAGIEDADAGRYITILGPEDAEALHRRVMQRVAERLAAER
jgi:Arc/MetJ-type ribon-helix-helix transcriptional regulator